jgi:hypothetical protein
MTSPPQKPAPFVLPNHGLRNTLIAIGAGILLLVFVGYGVLHMGSPVQGNKLTGQIVEKVFTPLNEQQVSFSGRRIEGVKESAGEYVLKVSVGPEKRIYEVPVEQFMYDSRKVGDSLTFLRPPSEQR